MLMMLQKNHEFKFDTDDTKNVEYSTNFIINISSSFGEKGQPSSSGYPTLNITGRVHFGGVEIHYL